MSTAEVRLPSPGGNVRVDAVHVSDGRIVGYSRWAPYSYGGTQLGWVGEEPTDRRDITPVNDMVRQLALQTPVDDGTLPLAAWMEGPPEFTAQLRRQLGVCEECGGCTRQQPHMWHCSRR